MNWKEEVIEKLRRYPLMISAVQAIPMELKRLKLEAKALQSGTGKLGGRNLRAQENRLLDNLLRQQELEQQRLNAEAWVDFTSSALEQLDDRQRKLLTRLYIEGADALAVSMELEEDRSSLYRHRDAALKQLTLAMYGALES